MNWVGILFLKICYSQRASLKPGGCFASTNLSHTHLNSLGQEWKFQFPCFPPGVSLGNISETSKKGSRWGSPRSSWENVLNQLAWGTCWSLHLALNSRAPVDLCQQAPLCLRKDRLHKFSTRPQPSRWTHECTWNTFHRELKKKLGCVGGAGVSGSADPHTFIFSSCLKGFSHYAGFEGVPVWQSPFQLQIANNH